MDWIPHKGNSSFQKASTVCHLHELFISQQVRELAILPSGMSHRMQRIYPSTLPPTCPTIWQGKERVLPLRRSQGWKPQEGWTLAAAEDPVEVAREGGWPAELLRREREDAQPEKKRPRKSTDDKIQQNSSSLERLSSSGSCAGSSITAGNK